MPRPVHTPLINNNDDFVRVSHVHVPEGTLLTKGAPIAELETDKATFTLEAEAEGYLLRFLGQVGETIAVGSILAWIGDSPDESVPEHASAAANPGQSEGREPTLKAALLLARFGISAADVPGSGTRLSAADVEQFVKLRPPRQPAAPDSGRRVSSPPAEPGTLHDLRPSRRGMLHAVLWQTEAVPGYVELAYDPRPWDAYAADFQKKHGLLMNPLLALLAWRLAGIAATEPEANATMQGDQRYTYTQVNVGFTVQSGPDLYAVVVRAAAERDAQDVAKSIADLQKRARRGTLRPDEVSGATIGFSSMARWMVTRHVPVLLPHTALMIAHTASPDGAATMGATYDHRLLHGADVVRILQQLVAPPDGE